jgi:hypothetical protein
MLASVGNAVFLEKGACASYFLGKRGVDGSVAERCSP